MKKSIDMAKEKCLEGRSLSKDEIVSLLSIPLKSPADAYLRQAARDVAKQKSNNLAYIWSAIGMDYDSCPMNCKFCSFGAEWDLIKEKHIFDDEEIIKRVKAYAEGGATYIVLRTTQFYSIDSLIEQVARIKAAVPGNYKMILNAGEFDLITAERMFDAGVSGVYHALRLREGIDTPFGPQIRMSTMESIYRSPLALISLVEPIGSEHSNEEIADCFLNTLRFRAAIGGTMARVPVKGTPLGDAPILDESRLAQITAVLRLAGGDIIKDICVHPVSAEALASGANVMVVEAGAIPRDAQYSVTDWANTDMERAKQLLTDAGYQLACLKKDNVSSSLQGCACTGKNLEKFVQPIILSLLCKNSSNGYQLIKQMSNFATLRDMPPDPTGIYRYLKAMEKKGFIITNSGGLYDITEQGRHCLDNWRRTLHDYQKVLATLSSEL